MIYENNSSPNQLHIHNSSQLPLENVVRSYQSISHYRLNIKHAITKLLQNLLNEFKASREIKKIKQSPNKYKILVDILTKCYSTLKRWEKNINNQLSSALYKLRKLNDYQYEYQLQQKYNRPPSVVQLDQVTNNLREKHNLGIIEYNKLIMTLKLHRSCFERGIIVFDENNTTNQEMNSKTSRPKIARFIRWVNKLREYFTGYSDKENQTLSKNKDFDNWKINLKLSRLISSSNFHSGIDINSIDKYTDAVYLRNEYNRVIVHMRKSIKFLLDRITLTVDTNRNIYGEIYNYKNHINELANVIETRYSEKLLSSIDNLKSQLNSHKINIENDFIKTEKLQKSLTDYTNSELISHKKRLKAKLISLEENLRFQKLSVHRIEWAIAAKENILNDMILESRMNLEKQIITSERIKTYRKRENEENLDD